MSKEQQPRPAQEQRAGDTPAQGAQGARPEAHAGVGSESALRQLRAWEQRRAAESAGQHDKPA